MLKRFILPAAFAAITLVGGSVWAQPAISPDQQQMIQQMQELQQQMMQNMQDKGIDPQQFFQEMAQQMQAGTLDPSDIQKYMMDKGVMTQEMLDKTTAMQTTMQTAQVNNLQTQLKVSDDVWKLLKPKIQKVLDCMAVLGINSPVGGFGGGGFGGGGGGLAGGIGRGGGTGELSQAIKAMRTAARDPNANDGDVKAKLATVRDAREKAKADLVAAQKDLLELLDTRQEAILTTMGIIP